MKKTFWTRKPLISKNQEIDFYLCVRDHLTPTMADAAEPAAAATPATVASITVEPAAAVEPPSSEPTPAVLAVVSVHKPQTLRKRGKRVGKDCPPSHLLSLICARKEVYEGECLAVQLYTVGMLLHLIQRNAGTTFTRRCRSLSFSSSLFSSSLLSLVIVLPPFFFLSGW